MELREYMDQGIMAQAESLLGPSENQISNVEVAK